MRANLMLKSGFHDENSIENKSLTKTTEDQIFHKCIIHKNSE